ncbi:hypothetical protein V5N11_013435 [Cardamine amara subsp. amara]|uniref:CCHC-type domain-containing protein n=1 Tax=Cardamine amara subsp. amara TaxID=228776 RepID=A0ABD0ZAI8_CARAN
MVRQTRNTRRNGENGENSGVHSSDGNGAARAGENAAVDCADNRGVDVAAAIQAALAPVMATLAQLAERLPAAGQAPGVQPVGANGIGVGNGLPGANGVHADVRVDVPVEGVGNVNVEQRVPAYLKVMEHMQKMGTRYFPGGVKPADADEWRNRMERNFASVRCPEQYKVDIGVHFLEGDAHTWWESVTTRRGRMVRSWEEFREEFNNKYFPQEALDRLESQFLDLRQGSKSVREYEAEFNSLKRYAGRDLEDERVQIRRFMRGMRLELHNRCLMRDYRSMADLVEKAAVIESGMIAEDSRKQAKTADNRKSQGGSFGNKSGNVSGQKRKWEAMGSGKPSVESGSGYSSGGCFRCGSKDHRIANCPKPEGERTCNYCKEPGHFKNQCPKLAAKQDQGRELALPPPPKKPAGVHHVYSLADGTNDPSTSRPITR